jgi:hypothetical protein
MGKAKQISHASKFQQVDMPSKYQKRHGPDRKIRANRHAHRRNRFGRDARNPHDPPIHTTPAIILSAEEMMQKKLGNRSIAQPMLQIRFFQLTLKLCEPGGE